MAIKNKTLIGVIGVILSLFGLIMTIPLVLNGVPYVYGIILTGLMVVIGVILIAWAFGE